ncbi:Cytochrome protein, partial [Ophiophagus hannah]
MKMGHGGYFHNENLIGIVDDLFGAGTDTMGNTLHWAILLMMKYPEIQSKVQAEIAREIGDFQPRTDHRAKMPYTDAVIHECQRFANIVPSNLPRATTMDITFKGFFIPRVINLKSLYYIRSSLSCSWSKKYGPIFHNKLGFQEMVVLTGYETVKEALVNQADAFADRARIPVFEEATKGFGLGFAHDENWKVMQQFTLSTLQTYGMGKRTIEDKITEECSVLIKTIETYA